MKYMILIYSDASAGPQHGTPEFDTEMGQWMSLTQEMAASGQMVSGDPLQGIDTATTVRLRGGDTLTTDGPFAETKEVLGGYYLIEVDGLDQALAWAARMPNAGYGSIEVRPIMDMSMGRPS
jgi:hypothetical protein